jgi:hypothetical protein
MSFTKRVVYKKEEPGPERHDEHEYGEEHLETHSEGYDPEVYGPAVRGKKPRKADEDKNTGKTYGVVHQASPPQK